MNTLPTKRPPTEPTAEDADEVPTWRELRERASDLLKALTREGKELERDLEPKVLPALQRLKLQIEKLIAKLERRIAARTPPSEPPQPPQR